MDTNVNMNEVSRISAGTVFNGEITSSNDIRIDGQLDGRVNSKGRLVVGEGAGVNGDVICTNVDFSGTMAQRGLLCEGYPVPEGRLHGGGRPLLPALPGGT